MSNRTQYRVMTRWTNQGEDKAYTIVQPLSTAHLDLNVHPLMHFPNRPSYAVFAEAFSIEALKQQLRDMLAACDEPMLHLEPERVIQERVVESIAAPAPDDMCPNCVTPWKCNGPHIA